MGDSDMTHRAVVAKAVPADRLHLISSANERLREVPQPSRQTRSRAANARLLARRAYTTSQGFVVALLADIGNLNALIFPEDLDEIMHSAEASFRAMSPFHAEYRLSLIHI